jgi:transposase
MIDAPDVPIEPTRSMEAIYDQLRQTLDSSGYVRLVEMCKKAGASNRTIAKMWKLSEATIRRDLATYDAIRSGELYQINGGNSGAASNDASPALKAVLKNLPKLTAAEREVVQKELDILSM